MPALAALPGDIVADIVGRDAARDGARTTRGATALSPEALDRLAASARRARSAPAAAAFGWAAYARRDWAGAAGWFADGIAWSPDRRGPAKLVEGYAASLHNACRFAEAEEVALSRPEDDADGRLRTIYVDSVADRVARLRTGTALAPADAARFASATVAVSSPNGAQALGWYAYRSRQFAAAAAWFEKALAWRATEAEAYGLALSYRRLGDAASLSRVLSLLRGALPVARRRAPRRHRRARAARAGLRRPRPPRLRRRARSAPTAAAAAARGRAPSRRCWPRPA